jgi:hypothetical protein
MVSLKATIGAGAHVDAARHCGPIGGILAVHEAAGAGGCSALVCRARTTASVEVKPTLPRRAAGAVCGGEITR